MNHDEYAYLASEVKELEAILVEMPEERVIDRMSFESRLKNARLALARLRPDGIPKKARLTFRGDPVFGSHGIASEFASKASGSFTEAFTAIVAGLCDNLRYMGPIPDKQKNQLIITGTAIGSFGFEYELPPQDMGGDPNQSEMNFGEIQNTERAMQKLKDLFRMASEGSDDDLSELVDEIHPRAVKMVAEFLTYLSEHEAWCRLDFDQSSFRFSGVSQVRSSADRLKGDNIKERTEEYSGRFQGALPTGRTFEFEPIDSGGILRGKVGPDIDPNVINRNYLYKLSSVTLRVMQVGQGRPRFTLEKLEDIRLVGDD